MYVTPKSVIVHKKLLISLCRMNIIQARTQIEGVRKARQREAGNNCSAWWKAETDCRSIEAGNPNPLQRRLRIMKYIEMILDSFSCNAAVQSRMEDACVDRWGFCLDNQI